MATPRSQRIGIWIIAAVLLVGTLGSFLVMILGTQNESSDQASLQKAYTEYQSEIIQQTRQLSDKYYTDFSKYSKIPATFASDGVKTVVKKELKIGSGEPITAESSYSAYYIGWNPKGVVFDQSIEDGALKAPIPGGNLITGWNEGVIGMKYGGVREITIPSDKAYGKTGQGDDIPPNTPIRFIVMIVPKVSDIEMPQVLKDYYQSQQSLQQ